MIIFPLQYTGAIYRTFFENNSKKRKGKMVNRL